MTVGSRDYYRSRLLINLIHLAINMFIILPTDSKKKKFWLIAVVVSEMASESTASTCLN